MLNDSLKNYYKSIREYNARKRKGLQMRDDLPCALRKAGAPINTSTDSEFSLQNIGETIEHVNPNWNEHRKRTKSSKQPNEDEDIENEESHHDQEYPEETNKENKAPNDNNNSGNIINHFRSWSYHFNRIISEESSDDTGSDNDECGNKNSDASVSKILIAAGKTLESQKRAGLQRSQSSSVGDDNIGVSWVSNVSNFIYQDVGKGAKKKQAKKIKIEKTS
jgi:hypothetical protein